MEIEGTPVVLEKLEIIRILHYNHTDKDIVQRTIS